MQNTPSTLRSGRGITVLSLLLLIIALVVVAIFLVRYLRSRPAVSVAPTSVILSEAKNLYWTVPGGGGILRFAQDDIRRLIS